MVMPGVHQFQSPGDACKMNQRPPDPHAPESQPTKQGRRLIRMLFRSAADDSTLVSTEGDSRAEDVVTWKNAMIQQDNPDNPTPVPAPTSKFASLKRKLFPSQNRRHPRHVPPLISPISAPMKAAVPSLGKNDRSLSRKSSSRDDDSNPAQENECPSEIISEESIQLKQHELHCPEDKPESDSHPSEGDNNRRSTDRRTLMDDDDDDLENAVAALDLETSAADKTLEEMRKVIDDLRVWKDAHENKTQEALNKLKEEQDCQLLSTESSQDLTSCDDYLHVERQLERKRQQQQRERETQTLVLQKEAEAYQLECNLFRTKLNESEVTRVEQALQNSGDSEGLALSRLRNELFQLDVKQRQEALLQELQGTDNELDMKIVDVEAFTGELDAILAQFDSTGIDANAPS